MNTKFFHKMAYARRVNNAIAGLEVNGEWVQDLVMLRRKFLLSTNLCLGGCCFLRLPLDGMPFDCLSELEENSLERPFSEEEIYGVIKDMIEDKAPRPYGLYFSKVLGYC